MPTTLCLDFGNTRQKCAVFINKDLAEMIVLTDAIINDLNNIINKYKPTVSILSSVINHSIEVENLLESKTNFHKLNKLWFIK